MLSHVSTGSQSSIVGEWITENRSDL